MSNDRRGVSVRREARTVDAYVDPHVARLVDAINRSPFDVSTFGSCSGHLRKPGLPYVAFHTERLEFVAFMLLCVGAVNDVMRGQTSLKLPVASGKSGGSIRLAVHPSLWDGRFSLWPVGMGLVPPPRRLVELWWLELGELARMLERRDASPSMRFRSEAARLGRSPSRPPWWSQHATNDGGSELESMISLLEAVAERRGRPARKRNG
jgi:hypothetical protein